MSQIEDIKELLKAHDINEDIEDDTIQTLINEAVSLVNIEGINEVNHEDYTKEFNSDVYLTSYFPIITQTVLCAVDGKLVTPAKILKNGIIHFDKTYYGELEVSYTTGIPSSEYEDSINLIVLFMLQEQMNNPQGLSSIKEGDVTLSYNTSKNSIYLNNIRDVIEDLRGKYGKANIKLI